MDTQVFKSIFPNKTAVAMEIGQSCVSEDRGGESRVHGPSAGILQLQVTVQPPPGPPDLHFICLYDGVMLLGLQLGEGMQARFAMWSLIKGSDKGKAGSLYET